jgi:transposase-like protein
VAGTLDPMLLTTDASGRSRPRPTDTTRRAMVARYHRSDLTQRAFCEQAGLPVSTLQWWLVKARREAAPAAPVTFTEVPRPVETEPHRGVGLAWAVEITTRTGVTLRLREPLAPAALRFLLRRARC